jgi:hypothetical protein
MTQNYEDIPEMNSESWSWMGANGSTLKRSTIKTAPLTTCNACVNRERHPALASVRQFWDESAPASIAARSFRASIAYFT